MKKTIVRKGTATQSTALPGINVLLHNNYYDDGSIRTSGRLIRAKDGSLLSIKTRTRYARDENELPIKIDQLIHALFKLLPKGKEGTPKKKKAVGSEDFAKAFNALVGIVNKSDVTGSDKSLIFRAWNGNTRDGHLVYFRNNILPFLCDLERDGTGFELFDIRELEILKKELVSKTLKSGKSKNSIKLANQTVQKQLVAAETIYREMFGLGYSLPEIHFSSGVRIKQFQPEHAKSLSGSVRYKVAESISSLIDVDANFAFHFLLMYTCGLRDGEACAVDEEQMILHDDYAVIIVEKQVVEGNVVNILKTSNAYRVVVAPYWGVIMIRKCMDILADSGMKLTPILDVSVFSARIKRILMDCGCTDSYFLAAQKLMDVYPDLCGEEICTSVETYLLRRDFASRAKNICGMSNDEIDALLGHKRSKGSKRSRVNYANLDSQIEAAAKLERFVFDPNITLNPEFEPICLSIDNDINLIPYNGYVLSNNTDAPIYVDLVLLANEPDEKITLSVSGEASVQEAKGFSKSFRPSQREIIGNAYILRHNEPKSSESEELKEASHCE